MKAFKYLCFAAASTTTVLRAGPAESAIVDAMKLADAKNYSWTTDVTDDARSYTIDGKTDLADNKDYSIVTMPLLAARRGPSRGGGSSSTQASTTAIFKGDEKFVLESPEGWKKPDETRDSDSRYGRRGGPGGYSRTGGYGGPGVYGGRGGPPGSRTSSDGRSTRAYSNLQQTLSRPHEEIAIIVAGYTELKAEADGASGTLSETNAKLLLVHAGQKDIIPQRAGGTFRLWMKDGELVKYQVTLEGKLSVTMRDGRREVDVHQTTITTLRDVGSTTVEVPEAAKKKLGK